MVSPTRRLNLDDSILPSCSHNQPLDSPGRSHYTGAATNKIGALFNDDTAVKNMGEGSTKYGSPSTPTACPVVSEVGEHIEAVKISSPPPQSAKDRNLDDTLGNTTQKSNGK